jgi:hypothetical protein
VRQADIPCQRHDLDAHARASRERASP